MLEFGKIEDPTGIDFSLPDDDLCIGRNSQHLHHLSSGKAQIYLGAPIWSCAAWKGLVYPRTCSPGNYLHHYSRFFSSIELNSTHYALPSLKVLETWKENTKKNFLFVPKVLKMISHYLHYPRSVELMRNFLKALEVFEEKTGILFLQLPPHFSRSEGGILRDFLLRLRRVPEGKAVPLAIEFRHSSWFERGRLICRLKKFLSDEGFSTVITDVGGRRDVLHASITSPDVIIRFVGLDDSASDLSRLEEWADKLHRWQNSGKLQKIFFFIHTPDNIRAPNLTIAFVQMFEQKFGVKLLDVHSEDLENTTQNPSSQLALF